MAANEGQILEAIMATAKRSHELIVKDRRAKYFGKPWPAHPQDDPEMVHYYVDRVESVIRRMVDAGFFPVPTYEIPSVQQPLKETQIVRPVIRLGSQRGVLKLPGG
jgi:hypothetical protein